MTTTFYPALGAAEIQTYAARLALFARRGLKESTADALADVLVRRDRDTDDRVLCMECAQLKRGFICQARGPALRGIFQRCEKFSSALETLPA